MKLREFGLRLDRLFPGWFSPERPIWVSRAPGRLDIMGGVADYSGSLVLELPLDRATYVALQARPDDLLRVWSANMGDGGKVPQYELRLAELGAPGAPIPYEAFRQRVGNSPGTDWVRYVLGAVLVLLRETRLRSRVAGINLAIWSNVPSGAGVASSAALEVATLMALAHAWSVPLEARQLALLAQRVENDAVGAPCGVMDQMTATLGRKGHLLALLCQPAEVQGHVPVPEGALFCGIDTGVKHSVAGHRYRNTRVATFMGRKIIFSALGEEGVSFDNYLCNISPPYYVRHFRSRLPARMTGRAFLNAFGSHDDVVTEVDPDQVYRVRSRTEHAIYENARVQRFRRWLEVSSSGGREQALVKAGALMYASHWSYTRRAGLGAPEADFLIRAIRRLGVERGFLGAKITGGGGGGTVAVFALRGAEDEVRKVARQYAEHYGHEPELFWGSSDGAAETGVVKIAGLKNRGYAKLAKAE